MPSSSSGGDGLASTLKALFRYDNISLHHVPNQFAPAALSSMLVFTFCVGVISLELTANAAHDVRLLLRPGWREPLKAINRVSYFACRYGALCFTTAGVLYTNVPGGRHCAAFAQALSVLWASPLVFVDLIFVLRTLAVSGWNRRVAVPLLSVYLVYIAICTYSVVRFGYGYAIPGTNFCSYQITPDSNVAHRTVFIIYIITCVLLDSAILLLTADRVLDGGLRNIGHLLRTDNEILNRDKASRKAAGNQVGEVSLSGLLLQQGLLYFAILWVSRVAFLVVYYALPADFFLYKIMVSGILATVGPVLAGMLFRQTSEAVRGARYARNAAASAENSVKHGCSSCGCSGAAASGAAHDISSVTRRRAGSNTALPSPLPTLGMLHSHGLAGSLSISMAGQDGSSEEASSEKGQSDDIEAALPSQADI